MFVNEFPIATQAARIAANRSVWPASTAAAPRPLQSALGLQYQQRYVLCDQADEGHEALATARAAQSRMSPDAGRAPEVGALMAAN